MTKPSILVTGATGFIGGRVLEHLVESGYDNIIATGRQPKAWTSEIVLERLIRCDLTENDLGVLGQADVVVHLAAQQPSVDGKWDEYHQANVKSLASLLALAKKSLIYVSTGSVYDHLGHENPVNLYGLSKLMAEKLLKIEAEKRPEFTGIVLRFPAVIGAAYKRGVIHELYQAASKGEAIELFSQGRPYRNFLHVDSAAESIEKAILSSAHIDNFDIFEIGSANSMRMREVAELLVQLTGSNSEVKLSDQKAPYDGDFFLEVSKAASKLNFKPLSVKQAIKRYLRELNYEV